MKTLDARLYADLRTLPIFPFYAIVRQGTAELASARERFLKTRRSPRFTYPVAEHMNLSAYTDALGRFGATIEKANAPEAIKELYRAKCHEIASRAELVRAVRGGDGRGVTERSIDIFGAPVESLSALERELDLMLQNAETFRVHSRPVTSKVLQKMIRTTLDHYGMHDWQVRTHARSAVTVMHGGITQPPSVVVPKRLAITKARAARLLTHEIEVHALRTQNSRTSNLALLQKGLDGYLLTEEGLAIYYQNKVRKHAPQHAPGFWDAFTCALALKYHFAETFDRVAEAKTRIAERMGKQNARALGEDAAWRLCVRAYRGVTDTSQAGACFARDHIYRSGLRLIEEAVTVHGEDVLKKLFRGNIGLHHLGIVEELGLPEGRMPEMVARKVVRKREGRSGREGRS